MDRIRNIPDILSGTALLLLSIVYFVAARTLPSGRDEPGPAFFPTLLSVALFLLAISILASGLRRLPRRRSSGPLAKALLVVLLTIGYAASYAFVGFAPATFCYTFLLAAVFGRRGLWRPVLIGAGTTALIYVVLGWGLGIPL